MTLQPRQPIDPRPVEGSIWDHDGELVMVDRVYDAQLSNGAPVTLVKHSVIVSMPYHQPLEAFLERYEPYDPNED